jgi:hypothetical protein
MTYSSAKGLPRRIRLIIIAVVVILALAAILAVAQQFFYLVQQVSPNEVGVKIRAGQIAEIVPPGVYSDFGLYVRLDTYSTAEYRFSVNDPEVLTMDQQRLGVTVSGSVFRPDARETQKVKELYTQYRQVFISDDTLQKVMNDLTMQAMKVCVGDRPFADSVVGSNRDSLRGCINTELGNLVKPYGLNIANVTVPSVALSPEVQAKLDAITQSRLDTEKALQDEAKAVAEGKAQQAQQEADVRVEQSKRQEQARQEAVLADLEQKSLTAQQAVIDAQKANDLLSAQKDLEIAKAKAAAAEEQAKADLANQIALAKLYGENPQYVAYLIAQANASAIKDTDKLIFTPSGTVPQLVFGDNVVPTWSIPSGSPTQTPTQTTP